jgi:hypothetical protein
MVAILMCGSNLWAIDQFPELNVSCSNFVDAIYKAVALGLNVRQMESFQQCIRPNYNTARED